MKNTIITVSPAKFLRMQKTCTRVHAFLFDENTWSNKPSYASFEHNGYVYVQEQTKEKNFSTVFKRYPKGYRKNNLTLVVVSKEKVKEAYV